jgi:Fe/S biogenesis protein NfuA
MSDSTTNPTAGDESVFTVTERARTKIAEIRAAEPNADTLALWIEVSGQSGVDFTYDLYFQPVADADDDDAVQHHDDVPVVIPAASVDKLRGATLDLSRDPQGGMVITNPNKPAAAPRPASPASPAMGEAPSGDLTGPVAERVAQVLEEQINPAIAAHGGFAELVAVDDDVAYLRLSGGCQGCGLAAVTLSQGIEVAIRDSIPEITRVVDVTDHESGDNPYFEAAKK